MKICLSPLEDHTALHFQVAVGSKHNGTIGNSRKTGDIVCNNYSSGPDASRKPDEEVVNFVSADGIQSGGRLICKYKARIQRERSRQCHPLLHSSADSRGSLLSMFFKPYHSELEPRSFQEHIRSDSAVMFFQGEINVLQQRKRFDQGPGLKEHSTSKMNLP